MLFLFYSVTIFRNYIQHLMEIHLVSDSHHYYSRAYVTCDTTMFGHVAGKSRSSLMHRFTVICLKGESQISETFTEHER